MNRINLPTLASVTLLVLAIIAFPEQYLFSKTVQHSFWTEYFPLPFGAGWFITFALLTPVAWLPSPLPRAVSATMTVLVASVVLAVPVATGLIGGSLTFNNLLNQFIWASIVCFPPGFVHIALRWGISLFIKEQQIVVEDQK